MIVFVSESLLEDELLSPLEKFQMPRFVLNEHLNEDYEVYDNISENEGTPPVQSFLFKVDVAGDECTVDKQGDDEDQLGCQLELEFGIVVNLTHQVSAQKVFSEHFNDAQG